MASGSGASHHEKAGQPHKIRIVASAERDSVQGRRRHQENHGNADAAQGGCMDDLCFGRQSLKGLRERDRQLKAEQRLNAGNDDARFGEQLVDLGLQRRRFGRLILLRHGLSFSFDGPFECVQKEHGQPEEDGPAGDCTRQREDALCCNEDVESQRH